MSFISGSNSPSMSLAFRRLRTHKQRADAVDPRGLQFASPRLFSGKAARRIAAAAAVLAGMCAHAFDADTIFVHNLGGLTIKPQLDLATQYTDNLFYGNDSIF